MASNKTQIIISPLNKNTMAKSKKQDAKLVAQFQPSEIRSVREEFKDEGITLTAEQVREAVRKVGHSTEKVYAYLREKYGDS